MKAALPSPRPAPGMPLEGRRAVFFGMGKSGLAGAGFLLAHGAEVTVIDEGEPVQLAAALEQLRALGVRALAAVSDYAELGDPDLLVVSPGVPVDHPFLERARAAGVEVIGEIELAYRFCAAPLIAVAGTNGKGSTTTLLGEMLTAAGLRVAVAGNIGTPLVSVVEQDWQVVVAEVSSYQLETIVDFHPWASILLNITPDHLARHGTFDKYVSAKARLFMNQGEGDLAVLNVDNLAVAELAEDLPLMPLTVSLRDDEAAACVQGGTLTVRLPGASPVALCALADLPMRGRHFVNNTLCAATVALAAGCTPAQIREGLSHWRPAAHQMTPVAVIDGVEFIDDSKATNPASAIADISGLEGPVLVVAGGQTKGLDMQEFADYLAERAAAVLLIGEGAFEIAACLDRRVPVTMCPSIEAAVQAAFKLARPGSTIILAPACASFDQFNGQAERGDRFAAAVRALEE